MASKLIDEEKDTIFSARYRVASFVFMLNDEKIVMDPTNILSIEKLDDFEFNIRSIIKVSMRLDTRKKLWILKNKRDVVCKFELDMVGQDREGEELTVGPETVWNLEFCVFLNDDDEALDTDSLEKEIAANEGDEFKTGDIESEDYFQSNDTMDVYLFHKKLYNASKAIFNKVFTTGVMQHFVGELVTETKHPKVLMSPIENDEQYSELLVPAHEAYKGLIYLDEYYGFYKYGASIFYDQDILYIINPNGKVTAKQEDEWVETVFLITSDDNSMPGNGMVRKPEEKVYYVNIPEASVNPQKPSIANNANLGSEAKIVITDSTTIDVAEADQSYIDQRNEYIAYARKDDNKYITTITQARMEENECILYLNGDSFDIRAFALNKTYKVVFEETSKQEKYGNYRYRISYAYHFMKAESESYMASSHQIVLKRCSEC